MSTAPTFPDDRTDPANVISCLSDPRWMRPSDDVGDELRALVQALPDPLPPKVAEACLPLLRHTREAGRGAAAEIVLRAGSIEHLVATREFALAEADLLPAALWLRAARRAINEAVYAGPSRASRLPPLCGLVIDLLAGEVDQRDREDALSSLAYHDPDAALRLIDRGQRGGAPASRVQKELSFFNDFSRLFRDPAASEPVLRGVFQNLASGERPPEGGLEGLVERRLELAAGVGMPEAETLTQRLIRDPKHPRFRQALGAARVLSGLGTEWIARWSGIRGEPSPPEAALRGLTLTHAIWMEDLVKLTTARIDFDGFWSIYGELREGDAEAIERAFGGIADPLMSRRTAEAAAMVQEHGIRCDPAPGVLGLPDWCHREMNAWDKEVYGREDLGADARLDLYLLRHADLIGGRRLEWIPDALPGEAGEG